MSNDEFPMMATRDDPLTSDVEFVGPFKKTYVLLNGMKVPRLTVEGEENGEVFLCIDDRLASPIPKACITPVVCLIADAIAVERGYGSWPSTPADQFKAKAPPFGPIHHGVEGVTVADERGDL